MINKKFIFSAFALLAMGLGASAQTTISFETEDFKSIGVYDQWSESPFRTGALKGNAAVTDNPDKNVDEVLGNFKRLDNEGKLEPQLLDIGDVRVD